jgi:hypothetical protein
LDVRHNDFAFMGPIMGFFAADSRGSAGINGEFKVEDRVLDTSGVETVPMGLDDVDDGGTNGGIDVGRDVEIFGEFREIACAIPEVDVSASVFERFGGVANGFAVLREEEDAVIDVVGVVHVDVAVDGFGAPDLRGNVDHKQTGSRRGRGGERGRVRGVSRKNGSRGGR